MNLNGIQTSDALQVLFNQIAELPCNLKAFRESFNAMMVVFPKDHQIPPEIIKHILQNFSTDKNVYKLNKEDSYDHHYLICGDEKELIKKMNIFLKLRAFI